MAHRRMFAIKIIESARFLKMPSSTRLLYYDLGMKADDDGIVEAFNVLRMTGATEDDLKILVAKGYVKVLNEDLVTYITDWRENNQLRADRKVDSMYKNLLLEIMPGVDLLEAKTRADKKKKSGRPSDNQGTEEYRLVQDSLGEGSIDKVISSSSSEENFEEEEIVLTNELKEVLRLCQSFNYKLKKIDAKCLIDAFGGLVVKKAIGIAANTEAFRNNQIKNYSSYLASILKDLSTEETKTINISHQKGKLKFSDYEQREYDNKELENELLGWDD